jgi:hypothetical protein
MEESSRRRGADGRESLRPVWATGNRIICDFVHRGIVLPRSPELADHSIEFLVGSAESFCSISSPSPSAIRSRM